MQETEPAETDPPDFAAKIERSQVDLSYTGLPSALFAIMTNATVIVVAQWSVIRWEILLGWYLAMLALSVARYLNYRDYQNHGSSDSSSHIWKQRAITSSLISGVIWGSAAFLLVPLEHQFHQTIIIAALIGMAAGGVLTQAALLPASLGFLILVIIPLLARLFTLGGPANIGLGIMTGLFLVIMGTGALRIHRTIYQSLAMSEKQQHSRRIIEHLAYHDSLTNLPNRRLLYERLAKDIARSIHHSHIGALLFFDLDNFKTLNDSLGHQQGDKLLKQLAKRLTARLRDEDTATRLGGDEFVLLLPELADAEKQAVELSEKTAKHIQESLSLPFLLGKNEFHLTASIGIALFPTHGDNADDLLKRADYAMYQAKATGRNTMRFYNPDMQEQANLLMTLEQGIRNALKHGELTLYYQPLVSIEERLVGVEALVRWWHPEKGLIDPNQFIPLVEQSGLIIQLGEQVLEQACLAITRLTESGLIDDEFKVSVNVSPLQFSAKDFVKDTINTVVTQDIDPNRLLLEVTENALLLNLRETVNKVDQLRQAGFSLAIDDFGTGQSSLAYIKELPIDIIKIDRILIKDINIQKADAIIVEGTVIMARKLGVKVVAEGVEDRETLEKLKSYGCHIAQGYHIGKPMTFERFMDYLQQRRSNENMAVAFRQGDR
ncbi:MAG: EAL domain-containing protein [Candidatus Thiodiazotropha sp. (ex Dulcina madagascariensis)]|nr:EAL domain-containing protein [Candidatus Thiodiazotropha sp. (ex Dulcina madagascariensis)]